MYGGFPHPNIFGGWAALGLILSLRQALFAESKRRALCATVSSSAIAIALLLTYSRSAWIAAVIGIVVLVVFHLRSKTVSQFFIVAFAATILVTAIVGFSQREALFARIHPTGRLEVKSIDAHAQSLRDGWKLFRLHPLFGVGPNAELVAENTRTRKHENTKTREPIEPPHNAYLLALVDLGIVGMLLFVWIVASIWQLSARGRSLKPIYYLLSTNSHFLFFVAVLSIYDHYLWSYWSGQALVLLTILVAWSPQKQPPEEDSMA